jgi:nickel-dependent lactate racemase
MAAPTFMVNVTVNKEKAITNVFAGDIDAAFEQGARFVRETAMVALPHEYDVVVTTNSGYPLDLNLYQAVKGMKAAAPLLKPGGALITAADCWDGIPYGSRMEAVLRQVKTPEEIIAGIDDGPYAGMDQWQLLLYAQILQKGAVYLKTSHLSHDDVRACLAVPCDDVSATLRSLLDHYGPESMACILPEGPQTVPYVAGPA